MAGDNVSPTKKRQTLSSSNRYDYAVVAKLSLAVASRGANTRHGDSSSLISTYSAIGLSCAQPPETDSI